MGGNDFNFQQCSNFQTSVLGVSGGRPFVLDRGDWWYGVFLDSAATGGLGRFCLQYVGHAVDLALCGGAVLDRMCAFPFPVVFFTLGKFLRIASEYFDT